MLLNCLMSNFSRSYLGSTINKKRAGCREVCALSFFFKLNSFYCRMMYINQHYKKYVVFLDNNKKKRLNTFLKQLDFVVFSKHYNRRKWCICWGLFSGVDEHIWWSSWCISFSKTCLKDFVERNCVHGNEWNMSECNSVAHWWRLQNTVIVLIM